MKAILRKLEYQEGVVFMTTNRYHSIDDAILSRMHIKIHYPALNASAREKIWNSHLEKVECILPEKQIAALGEHALNGRAIANTIHLASLMAGESPVAWHHLQQALPLSYNT